MAWPFSTVVAPNVDSDWVALTGAYVNVPSIAAGTFWMLGMVINNPTAAEVAFLFKDANGKVMYPSASIPAGGTIGPLDFPFMPVAGIPLWQGNGLVAKLWGYQ